MPLRALVPVVLTAACGGVPEQVVERLEEVRPKAVEELRYRVERGDDWAVRLPGDARVEATGEELRVDAGDGRWWFDVQRIVLDNPTAPVASIDAWARGFCTPVRWDIPAVPVPDTFTAGGFCTIEGRDHWLLVSLEDHDGVRFLTGLAADKGRVPYEDLWVTFVETALTVVDGRDEPVARVAGERVRRQLRAVQQGRLDAGASEAQLPRPGGGTFSKAVSEALAGELWQPRRSQAPPKRLASLPSAPVP